MNVILDLDTGIDDALALAYAIGAEQANLLGVTTVFGNVDTKQATANTENILHLLDRSDIPVIHGADHALLESSYTQKRGGLIFHGANGVADIQLERSITNKDARTDAADFLLEAAASFKEDLTIVATGPLTNIALAIQKDPATMALVKEIVIMGGAFTVPGNVSPFAEANISQDVRAANILFSSGLPVTVIGLDVTLRTLLTRDDVATWENSSPVGPVYKQLVDFYLDAHELISPTLKGCALHDPLAVAVAFDPEWITGGHFRVKVLEEGDQKGRLVSDLEALNQGAEKNVRIALDIDAPRFKEHFLHVMDTIIQPK